MGELVLSIVVFLALHVLPSTPLRQTLIDAIGRRAFMWSFSALSLVLFAWVWLAYRGAPVESAFWITGDAVRWASAVVLLAATVLLAAALLAKERVLLTGETALVGDRPVEGVLRITRHPMLWAIGLWGVVHMINNADAPGWVFFGTITALALGGTWLIDRRRRRLLGDRWDAIRSETSNLPFLAILQG
ncbi:MAG: NnrU family protein, partial [Methyloligellaceae bacterium]